MEAPLNRLQSLLPIILWVGFKKDFNKKNTFLGGMFTATNRSLTPEVSDLRKSAYSGGLDFKHQWKNRAYFLEANVVMSHVQGSKEAITLTQENLHIYSIEWMQVI